MNNLTNKAILEKAIKQAINNGFDLVRCGKEMDFLHYLTGDEEFNYFQPTLAIKGYSYGIIFNHDFAKSLWGEDE